VGILNSDALRQYLNLGIERSEISGFQFNKRLFGADVDRAISLLSAFNNAVFIVGGQNKDGILIETAGKFCLDTSGQARREAIRLDAKQFIKVFGGRSGTCLQEIFLALENEKEEILLVITSLEEFTGDDCLAKLLRDIVKKPSLYILGMTTMGGFRQLEKKPDLAGYLQFILTEKLPETDKRNKSVLIIGATSLLGNAVYNLFSQKFKTVIGTGFSNAASQGFDKLDATLEDDIKQYFNKHPQIDIVVYIAGEANADVAENERQRAYALNVGAVYNIARSFKNGKFVYISSEYVFDGNSGPYGSYSKAEPINYYGCTKLEGEKASLESFSDALVLRLGALYGYNGPYDKKTTVSSIIAGLDKAGPLEVDNVQFKRPLLLEDAASTMLRLLDYEAAGIYQVNGAEGLTKYELAQKIAAAKKDLFGRGFLYPIVGVQQTGVAGKPLNTHMVNVDTPRPFVKGIRFILQKQNKFQRYDIA